ncbi:MMPL family transporter [Jannaschia sp. R86511]|uniref:MMPL family transporter n=1 Tax=Jannaschia sp. R86511 TaxID=3093853 RepID=UPI0036D4015B
MTKRRPPRARPVPAPPAPTTALARLGALVARHPFLVVGAWVLLALVGGVVGGSVFDRTETVADVRADAESAVVAAQVRTVDPDAATVVAVVGGTDFFDPVLRDSATDLMFRVREVPGVALVTDAWTGGGLISEDGQRSLVVVELDPGLDEAAALRTADEVTAMLRTVEAPEVVVGGELLAERDFADLAVADAVRGESLALGVLCVVLVLLLGGVRVALVPLATALAVIASALLLLTGLTGVVAVSEFAVNIVTLLGLGLAVDYSLLVLSRFREERERHPAAPLPELLARTTAQAGRAVLFSGLAVGTAFLGLLVVGEPLLASMALGGVAVAALVTVAGITLVPALVALTHRHVPAHGATTWVWRRPRPERAGAMARLAGWAQGRPVVATLASTVLLLALCLPLSTLQLGASDARSLPPGTEARTVAELVEQEFPLVATQPLLVLVGSPDPADVAAVTTAVGGLDGVDGIRPADASPAGTSLLEVTPTGTTTDPVAQQLVRQVRGADLGVPVSVGGPAAELVDTKDGVVDRLWLVLLVVVVPTLVLLGRLTRSLVVPVKAVLLNLLTLGATLGVLVLVFQRGWFAPVLGFDPVGRLDVTTPLLLAVLVFGLSMDYEVFLLSRIREAWDAEPIRDAAANQRAVLAGITSSGPVVTAAAVCIGIVFLGFAIGDLVAVKEVGIGMTVALLLDVTVVRGVLLPGAMTLLGRWNWVLPQVRRTTRVAPDPAPADAGGRVRT